VTAKATAHCILRGLLHGKVTALLQVLGLKLPLKRRDPHYFLPTTGGGTMQSQHATEMVFWSIPQQQHWWWWQQQQQQRRQLAARSQQIVPV
jgi:hypothetical protein